MLFLATRYLTFIFIKLLDQMMIEHYMIILGGIYPSLLKADIGKYDPDQSNIP